MRAFSPPRRGKDPRAGIDWFTAGYPGPSPVFPGATRGETPPRPSIDRPGLSRPKGGLRRETGWTMARELLAENSLWLGSHESPEAPLCFLCTPPDPGTPLALSSRQITNGRRGFIPCATRGLSGRGLISFVLDSSFTVTCAHGSCGEPPSFRAFRDRAAAAPLPSSFFAPPEGC